jgi:hypothetical protein
MGGAGKTTLLTHLAEWWQKTGFVSNVCYFGYEEKAWSLAEIIDAIAQSVYGVFHYTDTNTPQYRNLMMFRTKKTALQVEEMISLLKNTRHLLILDNLESVTGEDLAIMHTLPEDEQAKIRSFGSREQAPVFRSRDNLLPFSCLQPGEFQLRYQYTKISLQPVLHDHPGERSEQEKQGLCIRREITVRVFDTQDQTISL